MYMHVQRCLLLRNFPVREIMEFDLWNMLSHRMYTCCVCIVARVVTCTYMYRRACTCTCMCACVAWFVGTLQRPSVQRRLLLGDISVRKIWNEL